MAQDLTQTPDTGLSATEVLARRARGLGNDARETGGRSYGQVVVENTFTFTNNIMFLLGLGLVIVGRPLDALVSVLVVGTNVVVGVVQEVRAKRTLDRISLLTRPTASAIRDGQATTVNPHELVVGDLVQVNAGDQFVLDGKLTLGRLQADESLLTGESDLVRKGPGDEVYSGSFCATGSGRYVVEHVGAQSLANRITQGAKAFRRVLTPLQRSVNSVIRLALVLVIYMELLLLLTAVVHVATPGETIAQASVLAGLIPNGLFVSIAVAYALGAVRLVRFGALVQQANAVESLSRVDVLCTDKTGTLTANRLAMCELVPIGTDEDGLKLSLSTFVASTTERNKTAEAIAAQLPGEAGEVTREVAFSSARKWSGATMGDGTSYVLGAPQLLAPAVATQHRDGWPGIEQQVNERASRGLRVLLLLSSDDPGAISGDDDDARLAPSFAPLGLVVLEDELRPGVGAILERFRQAGVRVKIISGDDPDTVVALARQAGLAGDLPQISGTELDDLDDAAVGAAAQRNIIFGRITPTQKERLVAALRAGGAYVAMIGDGVNDVLSLKKSNLAIAMASGSQASRGVADIVLTEDSFAALAPAVEEGQRIVNGMFDIIGLFLARIATMGLVIVSSLVVGIFPIALRNASAITLLSVGIPAALLALWAQPGKIQHESMTRLVVRFVLPAALLSSAAALAVFYGSIWLSVAAGPASATNALQDAAVAAAIPAAQSSLTAFLVFIGLGLIVYVEPPTSWLAVIQPLSSDRRPTILAIVLGLAFVAMTLFEPLGGLFALTPLGVSQWALVTVGFIAWFVVIRQVWHWRLMERFVGA
ncbi:MAG: HAD-IC family P-type ATPase [Chloroflexota bacterium]